jgi:hypothetical protein
MRSSPGPPETPRHSRLRGKLATVKYGGRELEQWEIEVTGGGRIFYLLDKDKRTVRIVQAGTGHPKVTELADVAAFGQRGRDQFPQSSSSAYGCNEHLHRPREAVGTRLGIAHDGIGVTQARNMRDALAMAAGRTGQIVSVRW